MSKVRSQDGLNRGTLEVNGRYMQSPYDLAIYVRRVRESALHLFSAVVGSIFAEDWTRVTSKNYKVLSIPKSLKVGVACVYLWGESAVWIERVAQFCVYRWNKFRSLLK